MKEIVFLIVLGCLSGCERHSKSNLSHAADTLLNNALREDTAARTAPAANNEFQRWYADKELEDYLDSIGKLSPSRWMKKVAFIPDSTFKSRQALDEKIPANDFAILKKACKTGHLDLTSAKRIFRHAELDSGDMEMD